MTTFNITTTTSPEFTTALAFLDGTHIREIAEVVYFDDAAGAFYSVDEDDITSLGDALSSAEEDGLRAAYDMWCQCTDATRLCGRAEGIERAVELALAAAE